MSLREQALAALCCISPDDKVSAVQALWAQRHALALEPNARITPQDGQLVPGRPKRPNLIHPGKVPTRSPHTLLGRAALLHAICHIEFNAINLALDAVWRFADMPEAYYQDWLLVAHEEAGHFVMLRDHLRTTGGSDHAWDYGDFDAHDGLWAMCEKTRDDVTARMALVPRTLEARGLDATPLIQAKLAKVNTPDAVQTIAHLDIILRDEIGHVAIGNHWYRWLCDRQGLDPVAHYRVLVARHDAPRLKAPFNGPARQKAGFTEAELSFLLGVGT